MSSATNGNGEQSAQSPAEKSSPSILKERRFKLSRCATASCFLISSLTPLQSMRPLQVSAIRSAEAGNPLKGLQRRRRIKCDEGHPCQSCLSSNSACTFEEPGKRTHPHKSKYACSLSFSRIDRNCYSGGHPPSRTACNTSRRLYKQSPQPYSPQEVS